MAWIETIDESDATGELSEAYKAVREKRARVANVFKIESLHPRAMLSHCDLYMTLLYGQSGLSRFQREMIALAVSVRNGCRYCSTHHSESFAKYAKDPALVQAIQTGYGTAPISQKDRAMLDYATKLTANPSDVTVGDVVSLRQSGFTDAEILDINLIASYFNFVNRVVLGLGVRLEPGDERDYLY